MADMIELTDFQGWESPGTWKNDSAVSAMRNSPVNHDSRKNWPMDQRVESPIEFGTPRVRKSGRYPSPEISRSPCHIEMVRKFKELVSPKLEEMKAEVETPKRDLTMVTLEDKEDKNTPIVKRPDSFEVKSARVSRRSRLPEKDVFESPKTKRVKKILREPTDSEVVYNHGDLKSGKTMTVNCTNRAKFYKIVSGACRIYKGDSKEYLHVVAAGGIIYLQHGSMYRVESDNDAEITIQQVGILDDNFD